MVPSRIDIFQVIYRFLYYGTNISFVRHCLMYNMRYSLANYSVDVFIHSSLDVYPPFRDCVLKCTKFVCVL